MVTRILFSAALIASISLQAMEPSASTESSSSLPSDQPLGEFLANAKEIGSRIHAMPWFFLHVDDKSNEFRKDIANFMCRLTSVRKKYSDPRWFLLLSGKSVKVMDTVRHELVSIIDYYNRVKFSSLSPDGKKLITKCFGDKGIHIADVARGKEERVIPCSDIVFTPKAFNHDGTKAAIESSDKHICIVNTVTEQTLFTIDAEHKASIFTDFARFNHDGTKFAIVCDDDTVRIFKVTTDDDTVGEIMHTIPVKAGDLCSVEFNPDDSLSVGYTNGDAYSFDLAGNQDAINTLSINESFLLKAFEQAIQSKSCIHADDAQWETWESLKATLNGGYEKPDSLAVQRLTPYIMKQAVGEESVAKTV